MPDEMPAGEGGCSVRVQIEALWIDGVPVRRIARLLDTPYTTVRRHLGDKHAKRAWPRPPPKTSIRPRRRPETPNALDHGRLRRSIGLLRDAGMPDIDIARRLMVSTKFVRDLCGQRAPHRRVGLTCSPCSTCARPIFIAAYRGNCYSCATGRERQITPEWLRTRAELRVCAGCGRSFRTKRRDAGFCTRQCQKDAWGRAHPRERPERNRRRAVAAA